MGEKEKNYILKD